MPEPFCLRQRSRDGIGCGISIPDQIIHGNQSNIGIGSLSVGRALDNAWATPVFRP
jgi:hypothetical protein